MNSTILTPFSPAQVPRTDVGVMQEWYKPTAYCGHMINGRGANEEFYLPPHN